MELLRSHKQDFLELQALGAEYDIQTTIIERKGADYVARGNAWGPDQGEGTVNTTPEAAQNHKPRLQEFYKQERSELQAKYDEKNPIAGSTLASAFQQPDGTEEAPNVTRAAITRQDQGREELDNFKKMHGEIQNEFPFYKLRVITDTSVDKIDLSAPNHPQVLAKPVASGGAARRLMANALVLNTGTTVQNPISDPNVRKHTFSAPMDQTAVSEFLKNKGLLDDEGQLKEGVKLAVGGTGLSLYDQLITLQPSMKLMERDESSPFGYKLTDSAKEKYQGALTVISNTPGKWIPPRHANNAQWTQEKAALTTPEELHAMLLHKDGCEIYDASFKLAIASVANTLGITPKQVTQSGLTTKELLLAQGASTEQHVAKLAEASHLEGEAREQALKEATWTLEGARRQAFLSTMLGLGMTSDIPKTIQRMEELAPHTFKGRSGYLIERAQPAGVTSPETAAHESNREQMNALTVATNDITASPWRVHELGVMLMEAGIIKYESGSYNNLKADENDQQLSFTPHGEGAEVKQFDAFIVSPTFNRKAEPALQSLTGQVKPIDPSIPDLPDVTSNRMLLSPNGKPVNVQDYGYNGTGDAHPKTKSKIGLKAYDVNNRDSAYDVSPGLALRRMARAHLNAAGLNLGSDEIIESFYRRHAHVTDKSYSEETAKFKEHFTNAMDKAAFVNAVENAVEQIPAPLRELKGNIFSTSIEEFSHTQAGREKAIIVGRTENPQSLKDLTPEEFVAARRQRLFAEAMDDFDATRGTDRGNLPKFEPASKESYFKRYIDYPMHVHEAVYQEALKHATGFLQSKNEEGKKQSAKTSVEHTRIMAQQTSKV
ncbi:hypothetical protein D3870_20720 [Noviherbaspirillum cavernae]|uniref:Uncharacterized protein n=2 Tax=Noviherbaspirillum cavernae TaxID=2320862 RepID=A0A418WWA7_9BURK|nr:hypothetical protein D3870_20720 [Noviherbaspirillum cavernae]